MLQRAASRDDVKPEEILAVEVAGEAVALYNVDGEVLATSDVCPHASCLLSENADIVNDDEVECSCHGSRFSIRTGVNLNPPASDPLTTFRTEVRDHEVFVEIS
jgi:3-phenylpropionate/trans-cinnamate dioxygenase ferredoxin component